MMKKMKIMTMATPERFMSRGRGRGRIRLGAALLVLVSQLACARQEAVAPAAAAVPPPAMAAAPVAAPFPAAQLRYQARLFELTEAGGPKYDAAFARQLDALLAPQLKLDAKFKRRMLSGPTAEGEYMRAGTRGHAVYAICQAHQCDRSTLTIAFDPASNKMTGKVLDRCQQTWLGQPDAFEKALLEERIKRSFAAALDACAGKP